MNYYPSKIFANLLNDIFNQPNKYLFQRIHKNISGVLYCAFLIEAQINEIGYEYLKITSIIEKEMKWSTLKKWQEYPKMQGINCKKWNFSQSSKLFKEISEILALRDSLAHLKPDEFQSDPIGILKTKFNAKEAYQNTVCLLTKFYKETSITPSDQLSSILPPCFYND
jgi:hypothetical protein